MKLLEIFVKGGIKDFVTFITINSNQYKCECIKASKMSKLKN